MIVGNSTKIRSALPHPQLPVVALICEKTSDFEDAKILFFLQSRLTHPLHGKPEMIYLGNYVSKLPILSAKWIPDTLMMAVLHPIKTLSVIC